MLARIRKSMDDKEQGFTLIELLVVIIIIGILAAIAIPTFLRQREKGWDAASKAELKNIATALESYYTDEGTYVAATSAAGDAGLAELADQGYNISEAFVTAPGSMAVNWVVGSPNVYCVEVAHKSNDTVPWSLTNTGTNAGAPVQAACP